jgi:hypothetical protein
MAIDAAENNVRRRVHRLDTGMALQATVALSRHFSGSLIHAIARRQRVILIDGEIAWNRNFGTRGNRCAEVGPRKIGGQENQKDASEIFEAHASK